MSVLNIHGSYFSITSPLRLLDRWFNPFHHAKTINLDGKALSIYWTHRAEQALLLRDTPLVIEMQLYFSCVVKKRLIFHDTTTLDTVSVTDNLQLVFRPVEALSCDPVEFAKHYPVKREFSTHGALKMHPSALEVDYKNGQWSGSFTI